MKVTWKVLIAALCYVLGVIGWCYVGGYMILTKPVKNLIVAYCAGSLTLRKIIAALIQGFIYLSLAGAVWCVGYILSNHFKE